MTILDFYNKKSKDISSWLDIDQILNLNDLEFGQLSSANHLLFPLRKTSRRFGGPGITDQEIHQFKTNLSLRKKYFNVVLRTLKYFGFNIDSSGNINMFDNFSEVKSRWVKKYSVEYSRISRILQSMMLLGFDKIAYNFYNILLEVDSVFPGEIDNRTKKYWELSVYDKGYWESKI